MAIQIKHAFTSVKGDGGDATLVRPSNWNAAHTTSMATGNLIGRTTAGAGVFEEIPVSAFIAAALGAATKEDFLAALGIGAFTTGDVKWSYKSSAEAGWVLVNSATGTIGDATSAATLRANADVLALWTLLYNNVSDTYATVSGGRGADAVTDFNAHKTMRINLQGRSPVGAGNGTTGLTTRALGTTGGEEAHALITAELASHFHQALISDAGHTHATNAAANNGTAIIGASNFAQPTYGIGASVFSATTGVRITSSNGLDNTYSTGSNTAHNTMHPFVALYAHVKL